MTVVIYKSTDTSAPVLSGQTGTLAALLKACLVNGYGSKAAAGWSNPYTGAAGQEVFRQGGSGFYVHVDDAGPGALTFQEARLRGYETTTAWATGTGLFPTAAQSVPGIVARKSATLNATARPWFVAADDRTFYAGFQTGDTAGFYVGGVGFGDIYSYLAGDTYKCVIHGKVVENTATTANELQWAITTGLTNIAGHYMPRTYTGFGTSVQCGFHSMSAMNNLVAPNAVWAGTMTFPNPVDGGLYMAGVGVTESTTMLRGRLRGIYIPLHPITSFADGDTFDGQGPYSGRSFTIFKSITNPGGNGCLVVETTDWESST